MLFPPKKVVNAILSEGIFKEINDRPNEPFQIEFQVSYSYCITVPEYIFSLNIEPTRFLSI